MALREHRIFGPPGTGKTTSLVHNISNASEKVGSENVFVASFTRSASATLTERIPHFPKDRIGTLHSHGYRAIGCPSVVDSKALETWNAQHPGMELPLDLYEDAQEQSLEDLFGDEDSPKQRHDQYQTLRNMRRRQDLWPDSVRAFALRWEAWKRSAGVIDYTDMIEHALRQTDAAPGEPEIGFFDEVQDFTPLELQLVRSWGAAMEQIVLAGDDDQMIYGFKGASVDAFLDESIDPASVTVLKQSYRVPRSVHRAATAWIQQVGRRQDKPYLPREDDGAVRVLWDLRFDDEERMAALIEKRVARGMTVMVLADAARMLFGVISALRDIGMPFHNPYAEKRGDWNPLRGGKGTSCAQRLVALSRCDPDVWGEDARDQWLASEVEQWADPLKADGVFARGGKTKAKSLANGYRIEDLAACFEGGGTEGGPLDRCGMFDLDWYSTHLTGDYTKRMRFPVQVAQRRGVRALSEPPKVVVGTIHSSKGAEADCVILAPDLSYFRQQSLDEGGEEADNVVRLFYVGMTRAKHELIVTAPCGPRSIHPHDLVGRSS